MRPTTLIFLAAGLLAAPLAAQSITTLDPLVVTAEALPDGGPGPGLAPSDLPLYQAQTLQDLSGLVPNLNFTTSDTRGYGDIITMRGQGNTLFFGPPSVALYVDDVPFGDAFTYHSRLFEIAALDVFRGPHGAMFGRNAPAGVVDLSTPAPGDEQFFGVAAEYGSYDQYGLRVSSRGPLGGEFGHSFQLYYNERDGFVRNTTLGSHTDDRSVLGGLATLYWNPQPDTEIRLRLAAERVDDGSQRLTALPGNPFGAYTGNPFNVRSDLAGQTEIDRYQASLHTARTFAWGTAKSITAWQFFDLDPSTVDLDLTAAPNLASFIMQDQEYWTQEFRFESNEDEPLWWRAGLFLSSKETTGDATRWLMGPFVSENTVFNLEEETVALFGTVRWSATDRLDLEAGGRLEFVDNSVNRLKTSTFGPPPAPGIGSDDAIYFSPTVGASYALDHAWTVFAKTGIGIKPHGFSAFGDSTTAAYGEERSWANELGFTYDCPDQGLAFTLRGFWNEIDDYQLNTSLPFPSTDFVVVNADEVTARGVEAEARWQPVDNLTVHANVGFTDAEFDSYTDPFGPGTPLDGNTVPYIPEFTAGGGFRYDFANGFFVQSSIRATGETFFDDGNTSAFRQSDYYVWDAEIGYQREDLRIGIFGRNLLDEDYYTFINDQVFAGTPGDPQLFGVRVDLAF